MLRGRPGSTVSSAVENRAAPAAVTWIWTLCPAASDPESLADGEVLGSRGSGHGDVVGGHRPALGGRGSASRSHGPPRDGLRPRLAGDTVSVPATTAGYPGRRHRREWPGRWGTRLERCWPRRGWCSTPAARGRWPPLRRRPRRTRAPGTEPDAGRTTGGGLRAAGTHGGAAGPGMGQQPAADESTPPTIAAPPALRRPVLVPECVPWCSHGSVTAGRAAGGIPPARGRLPVARPRQPRWAMAPSEPVSAIGAQHLMARRAVEAARPPALARSSKAMPG